MICHPSELLTSSIYSKKNNFTSIGNKHISHRQSVRIYWVFHSFWVLWYWGNLKHSIFTPMICPDFADHDEFYLLRKNDVGSMGNKHISYRESITIYEFFILFGHCCIEEILNAAYLPLLFCRSWRVLSTPKKWCWSCEK